MTEVASVVMTKGDIPVLPDLQVSYEAVAESEASYTIIVELTDEPTRD